MQDAGLSRRGLLSGFGKAAAVAVAAPTEAMASAVSEPPDLRLVKESGIEVGAGYQDFLHGLETLQEIKKKKSTVMDFMSGPVSGPMDLDFYSRICMWRNRFNFMEREGHTLKQIKDSLADIRKLHDAKRNGVVFYHEDFWSVDDAENMLAELFGNNNLSEAARSISNRCVDKIIAQLEHLTTIPIEEAQKLFPPGYVDILLDCKKRNDPRYQRMLELNKALVENQLKREKEKILEQEKRYETPARNQSYCNMEPSDLTDEELKALRMRKLNGAKAFIVRSGDAKETGFTATDINFSIRSLNQALMLGKDYILRQTSHSTVRLITNDADLINYFANYVRIPVYIRERRPLSQAPTYPKKNPAL